MNPPPVVPARHPAALPGIFPAMFTGLITAVGEVQSLNPEPEGLRLAITSPYKGLELGESIAVDGACLTVRDKGRGWFEVQVVRTSLERTLFGDYRPGQRVNLERALQVGDRLGGHLVQGHVDGVAEVTDTREREDGRLLTLRLPPRCPASPSPWARSRWRG